VGYVIQLFSAALIGQEQVLPDVHPVVYRQQYLSHRIAELDWATTGV